MHAATAQHLTNLGREAVRVAELRLSRASDNDGRTGVDIRIALGYVIVRSTSA